MENIQPLTDQTPITPVTQPPTVPTVPPAPLIESISTKNTPWLVIILVIALIGITSYFGFQNYQLKQQLMVNQQQTSAPISTSVINSPSPSVDPTVDWNMYSNPTFTFNFKYPNTYSLIKQGENKDFVELLSDPNKPFDEKISVDFSYLNKQDSYDNVVSYWREQLANISEKSVNNGLSIQGEGTGYSQGEYFTMVVFPYKSSAIRIITTSRSPNILSIFDHIVSSFEFVE